MISVLRDNTPYIISDNLEKYGCLRSIANRPVSELRNAKGTSLLVFPHSFQECEDEAGKQCLFSIQEKWKESKCEELTLFPGNLMGFVSIGEIQLTIQSRFTEHESLGDRINVSEDFFLHYMLQKVLSINLFNLKHQTSDDPMFDFLLYLFPRFLNEALLQGLYKEYQRREYNDVNVKGMIDVTRHVRKNIPFNGCVAYRTREFCYDNPVTQLVRHTIEYIRCHKIGHMILQNDAETQANVSKIIYATPTYCAQQRHIITKKNTNPVRQPYFTSYKPLQRLCLRILGHDGLKYGHKNDEVYGILFDGAWLWEEYLATILMPKKFKHPQNLKGKGAVWLSEDQGKKYKRFPDFYNAEEDGVILDAKYKMKIDERNDINQMVTYLYRLRGNLGEFILPTHIEKKHERYTLLGHGKSSTQVGLYYFVIPQKCMNQDVFIQGMKDAETELRKYYSD